MGRWVVVALVLGTGCAVIRPGEVGLKRQLGALREEWHGPGAVLYNPFVTRVVRVPTRTVNLEVQLSLPSAEGLNVESEISILYRITPDDARRILEEVGVDYEQTLILPIFRSAAADVASSFLAKDMHSTSRAAIETAIRDRMMTLVGERGFLIESVLMKSIRLPQGLARAVEMKLEAEQDAQRMEFVLQQERKEAERKQIEAEGVRASQVIVSSSLTDELLEWNSIQAFRDLAASDNTKVIVTQPGSPLLVDTSR